MNKFNPATKPLSIEELIESKKMEENPDLLGEALKIKKAKTKKRGKGR